MRKIAILAVLLGIFSFSAPVKAQTVPDNVYFFGDGKGYNENGDQKYFCFGDGSCYSLEGVFAFVRQVQTTITNLQNQVNSLQNTVSQLQQPVAGNTPVVENPIATSTPSKQVIDFSKELYGVVMQPTYIQFMLAKVDQFRGASYTLTIDGKTLTNGRLYNVRDPFLIFDGSFESGKTYEYQLVISGEQFDGLYSGSIKF